MRAIPLGLEPAVAPRSPTPSAGGSTPSEPAPCRTSSSGHQHIDNCSDIAVEASATWPRHGSVAPWGAAGCRPAVIRHRGFDSLPTHHAAVAQLAGAPACRAGGHGFESRRWRHVDVAQWTRHRSTKPGDAGSTPAVDAQLAVAQWTRAPPSEGGGRTFESCRRGTCQRSGPCSSVSQSASPVRTRPWVRLPPRAPQRTRCQIVQPVGRRIVAPIMGVRVLLWQRTTGGRRPTARMRARHARDAGSTPAAGSVCSMRRSRDPSPVT